MFESDSTGQSQYHYGYNGFDGSGGSPYGYSPYGEPPQWQGPEPPKKSRLGAIIAIVVVVAIFMTGLNAFIMYSITRKPSATQKRQEQEQVTPGGADGSNPSVILPKQPNKSDQEGAYDPQFSLEEFARPAAQGDRERLTIPEIVDKTMPAVVAIYTEIVQQNGFGDPTQSTVAGSGFIISDNGYVVTNAHVVEDSSSVHVYLADDTRYDALVIGVDKIADIAVLKIEGNDLPYVSFGDSDKLQVGELAVAIGNPTGSLRGTTTQGVISALNRDMPSTPIALIQTDAALNPGNSGGPLFNAYGDVVGINQMKILQTPSLEPIQGISFAIPSNAAKPIIEALIQKGYNEWTLMGITVVALSEHEAEAQHVRFPGILVVSVSPGGPGMRAGLQPGDVIFEAEGEKVDTVRELNDVKNRYEVGDEFTVRFERDGKEHETTMILQRME